MSSSYKLILIYLLIKILFNIKFLIEEVIWFYTQKLPKNVVLCNKRNFMVNLFLTKYIVVFFKNNCLNNMTFSLIIYNY